jgi:hypothetical protein
MIAHQAVCIYFISNVFTVFGKSIYKPLFILVIYKYILLIYTPYPTFGTPRYLLIYFFMSNVRKRSNDYKLH